MSVTTHDIEVDGQSFIMELTINEERGNWVALTSTCDDTPCNWYLNDGKPVKHWVCSTHQYDGTGEYPEGVQHPEVCDFSDVDEDGECQTEHETYDFQEYDQSKQFDAILAKNQIAEELADFKKTGELNADFILHQLREIEKYTGELNQPTVMDTYENA